MLYERGSYSFAVRIPTADNGLPSWYSRIGMSVNVIERA
jgi:hypothetical protein